MADGRGLTANELAHVIEAFLEGMACKGSSNPQVALHCAECCYGSGFDVTCDEELELAESLARALHLIRQLQAMGEPVTPGLYRAPVSADVAKIGYSTDLDERLRR